MVRPTGSKAGRGAGADRPSGSDRDSALRAAASQGCGDLSSTLRHRHRRAAADDFPAGLSAAARRFYAVAVQRYGDQWRVSHGSLDAGERWNSALADLTAGQIRAGWIAVMREDCATPPTVDQFRRFALRGTTPSVRTAASQRCANAALTACREILARCRP